VSSEHRWTTDIILLNLFLSGQHRKMQRGMQFAMCNTPSTCTVDQNRKVQNAFGF